MSTYINMSNPKTSKNDFSDCPEILKQYLIYLETIRALSPRSVNGYYIDLRTFFRYLMGVRGLGDLNNIADIKINHVDLKFVKEITKQDIYEFLHYVSNERKNSSATRARKLSSLKGFFEYCTQKTGMFFDNPCQDIDVPNLKNRLPKYLSLEESKQLLDSIQSDFATRDYCIITLFLNCGMRLSELVGLNIQDCSETTLRVIGKGNKERQVYLNDACLSALAAYLNERRALPKVVDRTALFLSKKTGKRLTPRRVEQIVDRALRLAGLGNKGYSTHKLRHTAATLMHQYGNVDMLALKEILGHEHVSTTEIYTHISQKELQEAAKANPLAEIARPASEKINPLPDAEADSQKQEETADGATPATDEDSLENVLV